MHEIWISLRKNPIGAPMGESKHASGTLKVIWSICKGSETFWEKLHLFDFHLKAYHVCKVTWKLFTWNVLSISGIWSWNMIIIFVFATRQILHSYHCPTYAFLCLYFVRMLIFCTISVNFHFILLNNFDKYHYFICYRINMKQRQFMSTCSHATSTPYYL